MGRAPIGPSSGAHCRCRCGRGSAPNLDALKTSVAIDNEIYGRQGIPAPLSSKLIGAGRAIDLETTKGVGSTLSHSPTAPVNNLISNGLQSIRARAHELVDVSISGHGVAEYNCHNDCADWSQHGGSPELYLLSLTPLSIREC
jgi:hypothetical protein